MLSALHHLGEFSLGSNPRILQPMRDILIDEKSLARSHLTHSQA
jgi:leucyl aminopeptidase (aminopeptidase T)